MIIRLCNRSNFPWLTFVTKSAKVDVELCILFEGLSCFEDTGVDSKRACLGSVEGQVTRPSRYQRHALLEVVIRLRLE